MAAQTVAGTVRPTHENASSTTSAINILIAGRLRDYADLLVSQGEGGFRSDVVAALDRPVDEILAREGPTGLIALPAIGVGIAGAIAEIVTTGHWSQMERLIGAKLARVSPMRDNSKTSKIWSTRSILAAWPSKVSALAANA
jgi:hypothetical protein